MTGIYIRAFDPTSGTYTNVELENLTPQDREEWLKTLDTDGLFRTIELLCGTIKGAEERIKALEKVAYWNGEEDIKDAS